VRESECECESVCVCVCVCTVDLTKKFALTVKREHAVAHLVEALCFKPEVREFDSRLCHGNFSLT
jgi:hypothetical protein